MEQERAQWKSRVGFLFAAIGSAVGLGNIWRFSYMCYENGGGAFLIPYFVALLTAGIPLMILEFAVGHKMRGSAPLSFARIDKRWEWLGWWSVIFVMFGIVLYYAVIISWCLNYLFLSFNLSWGQDTNQFFFKEFLGLTNSPAELGGVRTSILFCLAIVWFLNWLIVYSGIERGIERANKFFIPVLIFLTAVLVVWALNLPGAKEGVKQYLTPDFSVLTKPKVWIDAYSQIFFTLSLGFGIMIAYSSYLPAKSDIAANAFIASLGNCAYSLFAGFAVFGTLGYMAHQTGKPFSEVVTQSIGLAFVAYPKAISLMPTFSRLFGILFFTTLVVAGITSSISILEAFSSAVMDKYRVTRKLVVSVLSVVGFLGGIIFTTGGGLYWLDIVDHFLTSYGLVMVGILECVFIGWIFKAAKLRDHINHISDFKIGSWWDYCVKVVTPGILVIALVGSFLKEIQSPYSGYPWTSLILIGRDWVIPTLIAALLVSRHRWRRGIQ